MKTDISLLNFGSGNRLPVLLQTEAAECGLASLAMVLNYYGHKIDLAILRERHSVSLHGITLIGLMDIAESMHLSSRPLKLELGALVKLQTPCILHWDMDHFVVLKKITRKGLVIHDPASGERTVSFEKADKHFTGIALELFPTESFEEKSETRRLSLKKLWNKTLGLKRSLLNIIVLSAVLQVFALVLPFYSQLIFDDVLISVDMDLLTVLASAFLLIELLKGATNFIRSYAALHLSSKMSFQLSLNIFRHLIRLPGDFFGKRHIGDVLSRFMSSHHIRTLLTDGVVTVLIDGVMAVTTLILMFVYSPTLTYVSLCVMLLYFVIRRAAYQLTRDAMEESIVAKAEENSNFLETVRAIKGIKTFGKENDRTNVWQQKLARMINADIKVNKLKIGFSTAHEILFGIEMVVVMYLGAKLIMNNELSVGMLIAFIAYKSNFLQRGYSLIEKFLEFKILGLHLERLADIVMHPQEETGTLNHNTEIKGEINCKDISFRYASNEADVLKKLNFKVGVDESVAITGHSGCGKTTLMQLLVGLYQPTSGTIEIDGEELSSIGLGNYRRQIAAVHQDDQLLSGTIADNISFFDPTPDTAHVRKCCKMAGILTDIEALPMKFNTLIGDMGSALSGGQKQRIFLARALYKKPKIIILDEATSHLDHNAESIVNDAIKSLNITRIIIAHRKETIASADKVFEMSDGVMAEKV